MNPDQLGSTHLISACACDTSNDELWSEFLRCYGSRIKQFVARVCVSRSVEAGLSCRVYPRAIHLSDLFQSVLVRLVENKCAVMKAFSGTREDEWLAYLAVVTRLVVLESLRRQVRSKRFGRVAIFSALIVDSWQRASQQMSKQHLDIERGVLAVEVKTLCERVIFNLAGEHSVRNMLIFHLYYDNDLSISQIASCRELELSASGVKKVLKGVRCRVRNVIAGG